MSHRYRSMKYPLKVAIKVHRRPWAFDSEKQEIIERAMSNVYVGPKILKYFDGGKIEEFLGGKRHFDWTESEGCTDCRDERVLKQTAVLLARMHYAPQSQVRILHSKITTKNVLRSKNFEESHFLG